MIAVYVHPEVAFVGIAIPAHRTLEVVDELPPSEADEERTVLTEGEARALVQAGLAEPIDANFDELDELMDDWQRA